MNKGPCSGARIKDSGLGCMGVNRSLVLSFRFS